LVVGKCGLNSQLTWKWIGKGKILAPGHICSSSGFPKKADCQHRASNPRGATILSRQITERVQNNLMLQLTEASNYAKSARAPKTLF
jgi:hypothetical protein